MSSRNEDNVCKEPVYEGLFLNLAKGLRNFLLFKYGDLARAEDMVQEAFAILWKNCKNVTPALAKAYVYKVAQNQFNKLLARDQVAKKHLALTNDKNVAEGPQFQAEYNELSQRLIQAIDQLPDGQREVFLLNRMEDKTYVEIAELLEVSVKAIEKRMHKALVKLRMVLKEI